MANTDLTASQQAIINDVWDEARHLLRTSLASGIATGATYMTFYANSVAAGTTGTETAINLTKAAGTAATSSAASFLVTSGKTFRVTSLLVASRGNTTATAQLSTFNLRINTAGAVTTSSTPLVARLISGTPATSLAYDRVQILTDSAGLLEIVGDGTVQFGLTANAVYTTNGPTWDVFMTGFEY